MISISNNENIIFEIKKSKFLAYSFYVDSEEDVDNFITSLKTSNPKATHVCFAYIQNGMERASDDGEPSGTAGKQILQVIKKRKLDNVCVAIVRYFGGIKLGATVLSRTYSNVTTLVLDKSGESNYNIYTNVIINLPLDKTQNIYQKLKRKKSVIINNVRFLENGVIDVSVKNIELVKSLIGDDYVVGENVLIKEE